jgi:hypothetical protein
MGVPPTRACGARRGLNSAHHAGSMSLKHRVNIKLQDMGESTGRKMKPSIHMVNVHEDRLQFRACIILGFQKSHPHKVGVMIYDNEAIA